MPLLLASFRRHRHHSRDLSRVQYNTTNYKYNGSQSHSPARNLFRLHTHTNQNCTKPVAKPSSNTNSGVFDYNTTVNLNRTLYRHCARVCLGQWRKKRIRYGILRCWAMMLTTKRSFTTGKVGHSNC